MKAEYINPFIEATLETLRTMLNIEARKTNVAVKQDDKAVFDISAVIGLAGSKVSGSIGISFPRKVALKIASAFIGQDVVVVDDDVYDALGELANIVAGSAKKRFADNGYRFNIALPTVISGRGHSLHFSGNENSPCIIITFDSGVGPFAVQVNLKESK